MSELQVDSVFAHYGRVMAKVGAFEQFMRIALAEHELRRCTLAKRSPDLLALSKRLQFMDFGRLAQMVGEKFKFDPALKNILKEAKGFRNYLAHNFWVSHFGNLRTSRGRAIIERECKLYETQFDRVAEIVVSATGVNTEEYTAFVDGTADREDVFKEWEIRLDHADQVMAAANFSRGPMPRGESS
jgi:hypothetical protein